VRSQDFDTLALFKGIMNTIADMPQPNFGYFYLDANAIAKQLANLYVFSMSWTNPTNANETSKPATGIPEPIQKAINRLGGTVFVYSETSDRFQSDFFFGLNR